MFTIISAYGFLELVSLPHISLDPTRIASYIVAGIGFLGAGTIFMSRDREKVKGLTTAATIWVMAAIGIACGAGLLLEAITTTLLVLIVLVVLRYAEKRLLPAAAPGQQHIHIEAKPVNGELLAKVYETCARYEISIDKLRLQAEESAEVIGLSCHTTNAAALANALVDLRALPGVQTIQTYKDNAGEISTLLNRRKKEA